MKDNSLYLFGPFRLNAVERRLTRGDDTIPLQAKALELLRILVAEAGHLKTREELIAALWPDTVIEEQGLTLRLHALRQALGDDRETPAYIETVHGTGYRFIAPVTVEGTKPAPTTQSASPVVKSSGRRLWIASGGILLAAIVVVAVLAGTGVLFSGSRKASDPRPSIAVMPFENLSADHANAYFAAGIQDEILTRLAAVGSMKVISRTSTEHYASRPKNLPAIARQLGVGHILEGSVQRAGNEVHINVQLIDARSRAHIWARSYDRTLAHVFEVEGEVAAKIATALSARLTAAERQRIRKPSTRNPEAYDFFLRGRYYANRAYSSLLVSDFDAAIENYGKAVAADSGFALAYARLSRIQSAKFHLMGYRGEFDAQLAQQAGANAERAVKLALGFAQAQLALGYYRDYVLHDTDGELAAFQAALALDPRSPEALAGIAGIYSARGQFDKAVGYFRKALVSDPRNIRMMTALGTAWMYLRRYDEAETILGHAHSINPDSVNVILFLVTAYVLHTGDVARTIATLDSAPESVRKNPVVRWQRAQMAYIRRDYAKARRMYADLTAGGTASNWRLEIEQGDLEWAAGDRERAREYYGQAAKAIEGLLKKRPSARLHDHLGWAYARLERNREAIEQARVALQLSPVKKQPISRMKSLLMMAQIQAQIGHVDKAIAGLRRLFAMPSGYILSVPLLKLDPDWDSIRHDSRFRALLQRYDKPAAAPADATVFHSN